MSKLKINEKTLPKRELFLFISYLFCSNATKTKRNLTSADLTENKKIEKGKKKFVKWNHSSAKLGKTTLI